MCIVKPCLGKIDCSNVVEIHKLIGRHNKAETLASNIQERLILCVNQIEVKWRLFCYLRVLLETWIDFVTNELVNSKLVLYCSWRNFAHNFDKCNVCLQCRL